MTAPMETPFELPSVFGDQPVDGEVDDDLRSPAFRRPGSDLDEKPIGMDDDEIVQLLSSYFDEAENARETGLNPRHEVWEENLHAYWMRRDYQDKMDWQSQEVSASTPNFVERFAAIHRQALTAAKNWARIEDRRETGTEAISDFATRLTRLGLDFAGTNASGQPVAFEYTFGSLMKTGAIMEMMVAITWDPRNGRVVGEQVDPRQCYFDPTGRGLYRVRFWETDKETLLRMAEQVDEEGEPIWRVDAIEELVAHHDRRIIENRENSTGDGQTLSSHRTPILIKEWLVDLIDRSEGSRNSRKVREKQLVVIANDRHIIRGPEPNPWWHGKDWIVAHPVITAPLSSPSGRTYVELFRPAVETHENVTNRIIDLVTTRMNAFEVDPEQLDNPEQLENGLSPNQVIMRAEDAIPGHQAVRAIEVGGQVPPELFRIWQGMRQEAQEAASQSDLSLGNTVRTGETTATEAAIADKGQGALNDSIAMDIDLGFLGPVVELVYFTMIQKCDESSPGLWNALSKEDKALLESSRAEFAQRPIVARAEGLTQAVARQRRVRGMLGALNVIGGNPILAAEFQKEYSFGKLVRLIMEDFGVPTEEIRMGEREKLQAIESKMRQQIMSQAGGMVGGGMPGAGLDGMTSQNQGGIDPAAPGVTDAAPGGTA